MAAKIKYNRPK